MSDPQQTTARLFRLLAAAAVIAGVWKAWSLWFVNDDAFISFRYAKHLAEGLGLVYNPGERVEGFTNFLWTILVAGAMKLGADPVAFAVTAGIVCWAATLALWAWVSWRFREMSPLGAVPLTAIALALHRDMNVYATSGLETSLTTFLVSALFAVLVLRRSSRALLGAGVIAVLAMMTRPDTVIFLAAAAAGLLLERQGKAVALFLLPSLVLFLPYWLWRWSYYGFFFPNAFYAKSIGLPYYSQGLSYTWLYCSTYYVLILLPLLAGAIVMLRRRQALPPAGEPWRRAALLASLSAALATLFIIRVGGDFMFARFFVPVTPMLWFLLELLIRRLPWRNIVVTAAAAVVLLTAFRNDRFRDESKIGYIADEWQWYPADGLEITKHNGALLHRYFDGLPVRVAYWAGQAKLMYYADPYIAVEASAGLTDTGIAHQVIEERGRPGHEKKASLEYLAARGIHFLFYPLTPPPGPMPANLILFDSLAARIVTYDNTLMTRLAERPGVQFVRFPDFLDGYIAGLGTQPPEQVASDYQFFRMFYFDHNADTTRQHAMLAYLGTPSYGQP